MPSVAEILRASGMSDEEIGKLDAKVTAGLTSVLTTAEQEREKAELAQRAVRETYDREINPALVQWANDKASMDTRLAAYESALKAAKEGGFQVPEILATPVVTPGSPIRNPDGTFRPSGAPAPVQTLDTNKLRDELGGAFAFLADTSWKYRNLFGTELPDPPTQLIREATAQRMSPADYAAKKYDFAGKERAKRESEQKAHDDAIRKETKEASDKEWSEKIGNNPNVRQAQVSAFSEVRQAVKEGKRADPLKMTPQERAKATRDNIRRDIAEQETGSVQ